MVWYGMVWYGMAWHGMYVLYIIYYYCITLSQRLCAGAHLCFVSSRNIIKIKVPERIVSRSGIKDDRVKMLKVRNKLTVIAKVV